MSTSDAMIKLIRINIHQKRLARMRQELFHEHRMKLNRVKLIEDKLKMQQDILFRELQYSMDKEYEVKNKVNMDELFPESGIINLLDLYYYEQDTTGDIDTY
mgnify:CR=1 FL=1